MNWMIAWFLITIWYIVHTHILMGRIEKQSQTIDNFRNMIGDIDLELSMPCNRPYDTTLEKANKCVMKIMELEGKIEVLKIKLSQQKEE